MKIRRATPEDAGALSTIARRAKTAWPYPPAWIEAWREQLTLTAEYLSTRQAFVAMAGAQPAGTCVLEDHGDAWSIEHLWIDPEFQGRGIGRALVEHARQTAEAIHPVPIDVVSDPYAESFYLRLGARRTGAEPAPMPGAPGRVLPVLRFDTRSGA